MGLGFLTLEDSIDVVLGAGTNAWSYCVAIHYALSFHIALVFLRVSASLRQGAYSHTEKTHAWSENESKNSTQGIISFRK